MKNQWNRQIVVSCIPCQKKKEVQLLVLSLWILTYIPHLEMLLQPTAPGDTNSFQLLNRVQSRKGFCSKSRPTATLSLFSHSAVSSSLWPHGLQHTRLPCPSPSLRVCSRSSPLSHWCYLTIPSSATFSFCLQSFQHQDLFQWVSSSHQMTKVLELQHQSFQFRVDFLLGLTGLTSLLSKGLSRVFSNTTVQKH